MIMRLWCGAAAMGVATAAAAWLLSPVLASPLLRNDAWMQDRCRRHNPVAQEKHCWQMRMLGNTLLLLIEGLKNNL
jgi:hypothetical protein